MSISLSKFNRMHGFQVAQMLYVKLFDKITMGKVFTHSLTQPYIAIHSQPYIALHSHTQPYIALHSRTQPYIALHCHKKPYIAIYKTTKIVRALLLGERRVCVRECKHRCGVKKFNFSRGYHGSTNLKTFWSSKLDKLTLFTYSLVG